MPRKPCTSRVLQLPERRLPHGRLTIRQRVFWASAVFAVAVVAQVSFYIGGIICNVDPEFLFLLFYPGYLLSAWVRFLLLPPPDGDAHEVLMNWLVVVGPATAIVMYGLVAAVIAFLILGRRKSK